jgi:hypothetical protein
MQMIAVALASLLGLSAAAARPVDLNDLSPCLPAAMRFCDRTAEMSWSNLRRCGEKLATHGSSVGDECREILRRYRL